MAQFLELDTKIKKGKYKGKTVSELISENKPAIMELIRNGYELSEESLQEAHIKHIRRDEHTSFVLKDNMRPFTIIDKVEEETEDRLPKDRMSVENIIKELEYDKETLDDLEDE